MRRNMTQYISFNVAIHNHTICNACDKKTLIPQPITIYVSYINNLIMQLGNLTYAFTK